MLSRPIAITYGLNIMSDIMRVLVVNLGDQPYDAAPVPEPDTSPSRILLNVSSFEGITMPIHSADPTKNSSIRQTNDLNAGGRILRGVSVSAATMETYSGPQILHVRPNQRQELQVEPAWKERKYVREAGLV